MSNILLLLLLLLQGLLYILRSLYANLCQTNQIAHICTTWPNYAHTISSQGIRSMAPIFLSRVATWVYYLHKKRYDLYHLFWPSYSTYFPSPFTVKLLLLPAGQRVVSFASGPVGLSSCVCYCEETLVAVLPGKPALLS